MMVSGPNLNETSIVSGGYGGSGDGLIPTGMNDQNRTGSLSGEGESGGSREHRVCLRRLELCLEILGTSASMNPMESQPKASSQSCPSAPTCHLAPLVLSLLSPPKSSKELCFTGLPRLLWSLNVIWNFVRLLRVFL